MTTIKGEQLELNLSEGNLVVQDNMFVQGSYDMTSLQQKLLLIFISTIKKDDTRTHRTVFRVRDLADLMGITPEPLYRDLQKTCKSLIQKTVEVKQPNGDWEVFNIVTYAKYKKKEGSILLEINERAEPYLLELKDLFTSFKLCNVLDLNSKHSIRIYQLSKSSLFKGEVSYTIEEFKKMLKLTQKSYDRFNNITGKILNPSIEEINRKTDIYVEYKTLKQGVKAVGIKFIIKPSNNKIIRLKKDSMIEPKPLRFNNFEPRPMYNDEVAMDKLEYKLLGWDKED